MLSDSLRRNRRHPSASRRQPIQQATPLITLDETDHLSFVICCSNRWIRNPVCRNLLHVWRYAFDPRGAIRPLARPSGFIRVSEQPKSTGENDRLGTQSGHETKLPPGFASSAGDGSPPNTDDPQSIFSRHQTAGGGSSSVDDEIVFAMADPLEHVERKVFAERFDHLEILGSGGMGQVFKAKDRNLQRIVAVKRLNEAFVTDHLLLERFLREAQFAARLNHPNLISLYEILRDDDGPYLVLEYVDGESLAARLKRGPIAWREAVEILLPICDGVAHAHEQGIIHRDIKPANILVSKKRTPKLGDFGIARSLEATEFTNTGAMLGTLDYMAPEQMDSSKTADERADIYSLAATLYHMVTGEIPRPIMPTELPAELQAVILQAVQRQPQKRQANLMEFEQQLRGCVGLKQSVPVSQAANTSPATSPRNNGSNPPASARKAAEATTNPASRPNRDGTNGSSSPRALTLAESAHANTILMSLSQIHKDLITVGRKLAAAGISGWLIVLFSTTITRSVLFVNGSAEMKLRWSENAAMALGFFPSLVVLPALLYGVGVAYPKYLKRRLSNQCESLFKTYPELSSRLGGNLILMEPRAFSATILENAEALSIEPEVVEAAKVLKNLAEQLARAQSPKTSKT
jgi:serine/threonine protein kinase